MTGTFVRCGLAAGDRVVVAVGSPARARDVLEADGLVTEGAVRMGQLVFRDADELDRAWVAARDPAGVDVAGIEHDSRRVGPGDVGQLDLEHVGGAGREEGLDVVLDRPPYNFMIHTSPVGEEINDHYHWHFEIIPKLTKVAGFEWGTGFYINPTPPEESARFLREAKIAPALEPAKK